MQAAGGTARARPAALASETAARPLPGVSHTMGGRDERTHARTRPLVPVATVQKWSADFAATATAIVPAAIASIAAFAPFTALSSQ